MKRLFATLLSLLLLWPQAAMEASPAPATAPAKCQCCSCDDGKCCVGESDSGETRPLPAAPVPAGQSQLLLFILSASPAWSLPAGEADVFAAAFASPLSAARVPLFQRNCALLI